MLTHLIRLNIFQNRSTMRFAILGANILILASLFGIQAIAQWTPDIPLNANRAGYGAVVGNDGYIYVVGGWDQTGGPHLIHYLERWNQNVWSYVNYTGTFTQRKELAVISALDGFIYALGGKDINDKPLNVVERYHIANKEWSPVQPLPNALTGLDAAAIGPNGNIYALKGENDTFSYSYLDPLANTWSSVTTINIIGLGPKIVAACTGIDGNIYLADETTLFKFTGTAIIKVADHQLGLNLDRASLITGPDGHIYCYGITESGQQPGSTLTGISTWTTNQYGALKQLSNAKLDYQKAFLAGVASEGQLWAIGGMRNYTGKIDFVNHVLHYPLSPSLKPVTHNIKLDALWKFDNTLTDSGNFSSHHCYTKSSPPITFNNGKIGNSGVFANGSYCVVDSTDGLEYSGGNVSSFTIEGWIKPNKKNFQPIIDFRDGAGNKYLGYRLFINLNKLSFQIHDGTSNNNLVFVGPGSVPVNQWSHIAVVVTRVSNNSKVTVTLYINGVRGNVYPARDFDTSKTPPPLTGILIGRSKYKQGPAIEYFSGEMDNLAIYGRPLGFAEIRAIYYAGKAGK